MADSKHRIAAKSNQEPFSDRELEELQRLTFDYFLKETNSENGLVPDSTRLGAPCSIAPTGFALAAYPVGVERVKGKLECCAAMLRRPRCTLSNAVTTR